MEANLALTEVAFQSDDKLAAKDLSEHRDGKKEASVRGNLNRVIGRQSAGGDHTMGVRVMFEFLIPIRQKNSWVSVGSGNLPRA